LKYCPSLQSNLHQRHRQLHWNFAACVGHVIDWMCASTIAGCAQSTQGSRHAVRLGQYSSPVDADQNRRYACDVGIVVDCSHSLWSLAHCPLSIHRSLTADIAKTLVYTRLFLAFWTTAFHCCTPWRTASSIQEDAVGPERRRITYTSNVPHHARVTLVALASCLSTSGLRYGMSCAPVTIRQAPAYLAAADDNSFVSDTGRHLLRSASDRTCVVRRTHSSFDDRSVSVDGPGVGTIYHPPGDRTTYEQFKRLPKTLISLCDCLFAP